MAISMEQVRTTLKSLRGASFTLFTLGETLGLQTDNQRQAIRQQIRGLIRRGEVERVAPGTFRHLPGKEPQRRGDGYVRVWRLIRVQTAGWKKLDIAALSRLDKRAVDGYVRWLEDEGFVERTGRNGNTILWRTTAKGREQRETPWPPVGITAPYAAERAATGALCVLMFTANLDSAITRAQIGEHLALLTNKFCRQVENTQHNKETPHVV